MGVGEISVQRQSMSHAATPSVDTLGANLDKSQVRMGAGWSGSIAALVSFDSALARADWDLSQPDLCLRPRRVQRRFDERVDISGIGYSARSKKLRARATLSGIGPLLIQSQTLKIEVHRVRGSAPFGASISAAASGRSAHSQHVRQFRSCMSKTSSSGPSKRSAQSDGRTWRRSAGPLCAVERGLANAALQHVADVQFPPDLAHVDRPSLVREARIASDHEQPPGARKSGVMSS